MRIQLLFLVAFLASQGFTAPADRPRRTKPPKPEQTFDPETEADLNTGLEEHLDKVETKQEKEDRTYGESSYDKHTPKWHLVKPKKGEEQISLKFTNPYPSYNDRFFKETPTLNDGLRLRYYDYSGDLANWKIQILDEKKALLGSHQRALSDWRNFPKTADVQQVLKDQEIIEERKKLERCPTMAEDSDDWTVRKGFSQGSTLINFKLNGATGMDERASWYNTEHVYEKQILSKFFQEALQTKENAQWFAKVAGNSLKGYEPVSKPWSKTVYYVFDTCMWNGADKYLSVKHLSQDPGTPASKLQPYTPTHWGVENGDSLAQALASVLGSDYRLDHMALLEDDLNQLKGRMFGGVGLHGMKKLEYYKDQRCIKNPVLFAKQISDKEGNLGPDDESVYKDRVNTLRQPIFVWQYFKKEWERFASTSREIYQLLDKFDKAYASLQDPKVLKDKKEKGLRHLATEWTKGPLKKDHTFAMAEKYKKFLPKYLKGVVEAVHKEMKEHLEWMKKDFAADTVSGLSKTKPNYTVAQLLKDWETEIEKYSVEKFYSGWMEKLVPECFEKANSGLGGEYGSCAQPTEDSDVNELTEQLGQHSLNDKN